MTRTRLLFHHDAKLYRTLTKVVAVCPFTELEESNRTLFKQGTEQNYVIITEETIFHPQGGGQPSDTGRMTGSAGAKFNVVAAKMDTVNDGQVLHFGQFDGESRFLKGDSVEADIDVEKRLLYSRLHTAGHILGAAVRHLLEKEIEGFDELKASHFPDSAACEFKGLIEGKWKEPIQERLDRYIAAKMPVEIDWWDVDDFKAHDLERLIPDQSIVAPGEKFRVVKIVGAEVYPCGGTHVDTTDLCGTVTAKKISRSKGVSRVSYNVS